MDDLCTGYATFIDAYAAFLQSGSVPPSLEDDIHWLQEYNDCNSEEHDPTEVYIAFNIPTYLYCSKCTCIYMYMFLCIYIHV